MKNYFKFTWSEFKKMLSMPTIYIMVIFLLFLSIFLTGWFSPKLTNTLPLQFSSSIATDNYNLFYSNEYKIEFDKRIDEAENFLTYFTKLNTRQETVNQKYTSAIAAFRDIESEIASGDTHTLAQKINTLSLSLEQFKASYLDFSDLEYINFIQPVINTSYYSSTAVSIDNLLNQVHHYNTLENKAEAATSIINYVNNNDYLNKLSLVNNKSMKFADIVLTNLNLELQSHYINYINSVDNIPSVEHFLNGHYANSHRINLLNAIVDVKTYIENISDSNYNIIYINSTVQTKTIDALNNAYRILNLTSENSVVYSKHREATAALRALNLVPQITTYNAEKVLINVSKKSIDDLNDLFYNHVESNITSLLQSIEEARNENNNDGIVKSIKNYYLLSLETKNAIHYTILTDSTANLNDSAIKNFYGDGFSEYNRYDYQTKILLSIHYIQNNKYSIDYHKSFEFNTISYGTEVNSFDYAVFVSYIASLVLILFIIILAVKNITQESSTGTIKLTLVRPMSRINILLSKATAITLVTMLLYTFSFLSALIVGANYFTPALAGTVITIFNASRVLTISSDILLLLFYLFTLLELAFYVSLAVLFAVIFRKKTFAYISSFIVVVLLFVTKVFLSNTVFLSALPILNTNFYKYFAIKSNFDNSLLYKLFDSPVIQNMDLVFSVSIYFGYYIVFMLISHAIFKSRDY